MYCHIGSFDLTCLFYFKGGKGNEGPVGPKGDQGDQVSGYLLTLGLL